PFRGASNQELLAKHIAEKPDSPQVYNNDVSDDFSSLILHLLAKKRQDRPRDFHEVLMKLRNMRVFKTDVASAATLMPCEYCKKRIPSNSTSCIHCGAYNPFEPPH